MKIEWVNHASFVIETGGVRLLCDPWIEGTAFNDGWGLVSETRFTYADFSGITHIWFSHEHPDHFVPPNLKRIDPAVRASITVLYQATEDHKVAKFCRMLGFADVVELAPGVEHALAPGVGVVCRRMQRNQTDSWLLLRAADGVVLNLNDCVFPSEAELREVPVRPGELDVLFLQFSYANWTGNRDEVQLRRDAAREKLDEMSRAIAWLQPKSVVPFASFVWFCNRDNEYMNDAANRIEDVLAWLRGRAQPVVLHPGDGWVVGTPHDSDAAARAYAADRAARLESAPRIDSPKVAVEALVTAAEGFRTRALAKNDARKLRGLAPCRFFVSDHGRSYRFSFAEGLQEDATPEAACDVSLASQPLAYCFDWDWGFDTLLVSGRFQKPPQGRFQNFDQYQWVAHLNNHGGSIPGLPRRILNRARRLFGLRPSA